VFDFAVIGGGIVGLSNSVHVFNAPSPAATASIPIGEEIAGRIAEA
jgi:L-2-hydroxyglutarate oxidase